MGIFLTAIPVRRRRSQPLPFLREAENCNSLRQGLRNGILKVLKIRKTYLSEYHLTPNLLGKTQGGKIVKI